MTLNVPVIAAHQLNRGVQSRDDHRPTLSDLRDSGKLEEDADLVLFMYREDYYNPVDDNRPPPPTEIIVGKQRQGERNIGIKVYYDPKKQMYRDLISQESAARLT